MSFLDDTGLARFWEKIRSALSLKQDTLTPDSSITLQNGNISVFTPVRRVVTQEEYDALPEEEKTSGLWVVPEAQAGESGPYNVYSEEEQVVGRWIDGKPLYRKVVTGTTGAVSGYSTIELENVDKIIFWSGFISHASRNAYVSFPMGSLEVHTSPDGSVDFFVAGAAYAYRDYVLSVDYTKITDQATNRTRRRRRT